MYRLGIQLVTEHNRCGEKIGEIGRIDAFEFDNQQTYSLNPPVKVLPGDALMTTYRFDTMNSSVAVLGGEETMNEICFNFLSVYPYVGTSSDPDYFAACTSFEHGIQTTNRDIDARFAVAGKDSDVLVREFESEPEQSFSLCCATNASCEEMYLASQGDPWTNDIDCQNDMICRGGLCGNHVAPPASSDLESTASGVPFFCLAICICSLTHIFF